MRLSLPVVSLVVLALALPVGHADAAKPRRPKAELVTSAVTASLTGRQVTASATVTNKGMRKKAKASTLGLTLSRDASPSADDLPLTTVPTTKLKPRTSATLGASAALPAAASGSYVVLACADSTGVVKEKKEGDNCAASGAITVAPATVRIVATAGTGGTVAASGVTGGTCSGTDCTLVTGQGGVTFTPTAAAGYFFSGWSGAGCFGTDGTGDTRVFAQPATSSTCLASFTKLVTVSYSYDVFVGSVSATGAEGATCPPAGTSGGSCTTRPGTGVVTLRASGLIGYRFSSWSGAGCPGGGATIAIAAPTSDVSCEANFTAEV